MSTWIYIRCESHDPPLESEDESGQHLYDLPQIRADIADRERLVEWYTGDNASGLWYELEYFRRHTVKFLAKHQRCQIGIRDEYGREWPLVDEDEEEKQ